MNAPVLSHAAEYRAERVAFLFQAFASRLRIAQQTRAYADWHEAASAWEEFCAFSDAGGFLDEVIAKIVTSSATTLDHETRALVEPLSLHAGSEIEIAFELAAHAAARLRKIPLERLDPDDSEMRADRVSITPQKVIGKYRADFLIACGGPDAPRLVVECDGHDFHEKTREQASADRARDRFFQEQGLSVYRFTGSDIFRDPFSCADQVMTWIEKHLSPAGEANLGEN